MSTPRYQDLKGKAIPDVVLAPGALARVVAGEITGVAGPLESIVGNPLYLDITLEANRGVSIPVEIGHTAFIYIVEGAVEIHETRYAPQTIVLFERAGELVTARAGGAGARFLLIAGAPLNEPIAWHGPIVMNTSEELHQAFTDLREGTFIRTD